MKNLTLRQIKIFQSAAKHLSFSRAAEELHVSAPAVSLQIKEMEADIGVNLFTRENRKVRLTSAGEYFLLYARRVSSTLNEAATMMDQLRGTEFSTLKIGMVSTAQYFLPQLLVQFKLECPHVQIRVEVRNRKQLVELLREAEIDIAIMGRPPKEIETGLEPIAEHPHAFIASTLNPLAGKAKLSPQVLNQFELISRESGSGTRFIMEKYLAEHNISPIVSMEMSSNESIKQAVMSNLGISFVSLHTIGWEIANHEIAILDIIGTPVMRTWHVVSLNKSSTSHTALAFKSFMQKKGGGILNALFAPAMQTLTAKTLATETTTTD